MLTQRSQPLIRHPSRIPLPLFPSPLFPDLRFTPMIAAIVHALGPFTVVSAAIASIVTVLWWALLHGGNRTAASSLLHRPTKGGKNADSNLAMPRKIKIIYATQKGTARDLAHKLLNAIRDWRSRHESAATLGYLNEDRLPAPWLVDVVNAADYEVDDLAKEQFVIFIVSTYTGGHAPPSCESFEALFQSVAHDFRYNRDMLQTVHVGVFGLGDRNYKDHFNGFAKNIAQWCETLKAKFLVKPRYTSEATVAKDFQSFTLAVLKRLDGLDAAVSPSSSCCGGGSAAAGEATSCCQSRRRPAHNDDGTLIESEEEEPADDDAGGGDDVEDLVDDPSRRELLYPRLRENLTKQGYSLIGSHSGVKVCRWTKSMLRGRGGCYKHTFYNISSFQCMEMTPALACANKCVFCWRHHTNPVTREFKWRHDPPEFLVENALAAHRGMMKQLRGVPGVLPDRFQEAMTVKHCALSLVGEPIIYPEINRFVSLLHQQHISTFMVTNAQFPDRIDQLVPVTQLYVSIDAATKDTLREIDRPLFEDFWERYLASITSLSLKKQRTVFRLTLVQGYNMGHMNEYVSLVRLGNPDFIEVKGVTYCGTNDASPLTMKNVPYHEQVVQFCHGMEQALGGEYGLACEHAHSCCMLLAKKKFHIDGVWHTWIDYGKFFSLVQTGRTDFTALDYAAATPGWATFNSSEHGFDPLEVKHVRRGAKKDEPITSGC